MTEKQKVTPNMKAAKNESGKSMVEMLGVLALMGLLAILGAKGYNMAMERAMANNIINEVNRRSVVYSQQMIANGDLSSTEFENEKNLGSSVVTGEKLGSQLFRVKVTEVSSASCRHIINSGYDRPIQITADDVVVTKDNLEACGELETTMGFVFTKELRPCADCLAEGVTACAGDYECPRNQSCQNGVCHVRMGRVSMFPVIARRIGIVKKTNSVKFWQQKRAGLHVPILIFGGAVKKSERL